MVIYRCLPYHPQDIRMLAANPMRPRLALAIFAFGYNEPTIVAAATAIKAEGVHSPRRNQNTSLEL